MPAGAAVPILPRVDTDDKGASQPFWGSRAGDVISRFSHNLSKQNPQSPKPRKQRKGPPDITSAHKCHRNGREWGHVAVHAVELAGIAALTIKVWPLMLIAGYAYFEAARHNAKVHHREKRKGIYRGEVCRYLDIKFAYRKPEGYGRTVVKDKPKSAFRRFIDRKFGHGAVDWEHQVPENFRLYKEGRHRKQYWVRGFVTAFVARGVTFGALSHIPARIRDLHKKIKHYTDPDDPLRPRHRKEAHRSKNRPRRGWF